MHDIINILSEGWRLKPFQAFVSVMCAFTAIVCALTAVIALSRGYVWFACVEIFFATFNGCFAWINYYIVYDALKGAKNGQSKPETKA